MQRIEKKSESLRNKKRVLKMKRPGNIQKRAVCGQAKIDGNDLMLITIVEPLKEDVMWILSKDMCTPEEMFDALGDKINALKNEGFEIDYRFDKPITVDL